MRYGRDCHRESVRHLERAFCSVRATQHWRGSASVRRYLPAVVEGSGASQDRSERRGNVSGLVRAVNERPISSSKPASSSIDGVRAICLPLFNSPRRIHQHQDPAEWTEREAGEDSQHRLALPCSQRPSDDATDDQEWDEDGRGHSPIVTGRSTRLGPLAHHSSCALAWTKSQSFTVEQRTPSPPLPTGTLMSLHITIRVESSTTSASRRTPASPSRT